MAMSYVMRRLRLIGRKVGRRDPLDERVRRTLVQSLYTQPVSMAIGLLVGVVSSGIAALITGLVVLDYACVILGIIAAGRVWLTVSVSADDPRFSTISLSGYTL